MISEDTILGGGTLDETTTRGQQSLLLFCRPTTTSPWTDCLSQESDGGRIVSRRTSREATIYVMHG